MIKNQISHVFFVPGVLHYGSKKFHKTQTNNRIFWEDKEAHKHSRKRRIWSIRFSSVVHLWQVQNSAIPLQKNHQCWQGTSGTYQSPTCQPQLFHNHSQKVKWRMVPQILLDPKKGLATRYFFLSWSQFSENYWHMEPGHRWTFIVPLETGLPSKISSVSRRR